MTKKTPEQNLKTKNPTQSQLSSLLEHFQNGRLNDAEKLAVSITREFPEHQYAWKVLGAVFGATGRKSEAADANQTAVTLSPQDAAARNNLGITLHELDRLDEAEASYRQAIALKSDFAEAHYNLGVTLQALDRLDKAEESYRQAIALKPDYAEAHSNLGNVLGELGRLDEAEACYRQAVDLKPDYAEAYNNLGNALQELGKLDEAEASLRHALSLKPDYAEVHGNLGNTLKALNKLDEAEASYRQALSLRPDYAEVLCNLGNTLKESGRLDEAETSYRQAIASQPNSAVYHYNLGITLNDQGKLDEAIISLNQALSLKPNYDKAHFNLAVTFKELGRLDEAEASYRQALLSNPNYTEAHNQLLDCLFLQDKKSIFFDELNHLINHEKASAIIGSLTCRAALKYGVEKPNLFCTKPLNYVLHNNLNTRYDFEKIFVEKAKSLLNKNQVLNRRQSLLVNGHQTLGNIFDIKNDDTNEIQNIIRIEVERYLEKFKVSEEGLIKKMPDEYNLNGWFIRMKSGGSLKPHIHTEGWLSGSIYINVPGNLISDSGNLVVSIGEEKDAVSTRINEKKIINVVTGSMVLFPASLMHHTIPFESEEERIVLAFDVIEK